MLKKIGLWGRSLIENLSWSRPSDSPEFGKRPFWLILDHLAYHSPSFLLKYKFQFFCAKANGLLGKYGTPHENFIRSISSRIFIAKIIPSNMEIKSRYINESCIIYEELQPDAGWRLWGGGGCPRCFVLGVHWWAYGGRGACSMETFMLWAFLVLRVPAGWCWVRWFHWWLLSLRLPWSVFASPGAGRRPGPLWGAFSAFIL